MGLTRTVVQQREHQILSLVSAPFFTCITRPLGLQLSGLPKMKPSRKLVPAAKLPERIGQIETNSVAKICGEISRMVAPAAPP